MIFPQIDQAPLEVFRRLIHLRNFARRHVFGRDQMALLFREGCESVPLVVDRKALRLDVLVLAIEDAVIHAGLGRLGVLLHVQKPANFRSVGCQISTIPFRSPKCRREVGR